MEIETNKQFERDCRHMMLTEAKRLVKLLEQEAPEQVIFGEIALLFSRSMMLNGKDMGIALGHHLSNLLRTAAGRCQECGRVSSVGNVWCSSCEEQMEKEFGKYEAGQSETVK